MIVEERDYHIRPDRLSQSVDTCQRGGLPLQLQLQHLDRLLDLQQMRILTPTEFPPLR
jgi:hypothetical protein